MEDAIFIAQLKELISKVTQPNPPRPNDWYKKFIKQCVLDKLADLNQQPQEPL